MSIPVSAVANVAAVCLSASTLCGCGTPESTTGPAPIDTTLINPATPAVLGANNGLEMRVWVVEDQDDVLAAAIARYEARPTPMLDSVRTAWRASGFRVIQVPLDELTALRERLRIVAPEQRDWFGQSPAWSEAVAGRLIEAGTAVRLSDGMMKTPGGRLRMLMRCWAVPGDRLPEPALHLELAVQLERRAAAPGMLDLPALANELEAGVVFPRLSSVMRLVPDSALLIVPIAESVETPVAEEAGPPVPLTPTLGEAMLSSAAPGSIGPVRRRAVLALLPRLPDRFVLSTLSDADAPSVLRSR